MITFTCNCGRNLPPDCRCTICGAEVIENDEPSGVVAEKESVVDHRSEAVEDVGKATTQEKSADEKE